MKLARLNELLKKAQKVEIDGIALEGELSAEIVNPPCPIGLQGFITNDQGEAHPVSLDEKGEFDPAEFDFFDGEVYFNEGEEILCPFCMDTNVDEDMRVCFRCKERF